MSTEKHLQVDFLVVGGGIAGARAAIELAGAGPVLLLSKSDISESEEHSARAGVATALGEDNEVSLHLHDTLRTGDGLCREQAVRILVEEGADHIRQLIDWGTHFDRNGTKLVFAPESSHSCSRVLRAPGDSTGNEILRALIARARSLSTIELRSHALTVDLLTDEDRVCGAMYLDEKTGAFRRIHARSVLLATGGMGQVFRETTNPPFASGDGMCLAFQKGALLSDLEFVQFHPTTLYAKGAPRFLLSEELRTQGGKLRNIELERFMTRYHEAGELAPPDIVSRAIVLEMQKCRSEFVYLDMTGLNPERVKKHFSRLYTACLEYNIDITADLIPVRPAAHYAIGGVATDLNGATTLRGLYAAGEVAATGVHGANRLAGNSLLEGLVYGARAARAMIGQSPPLKPPVMSFRVPPAALSAGEQRRSRPTAATTHPSKLADEVRRTMWEKVGVIRHGRDLGEALRQLEVLPTPPNACTCRKDFEAFNMLQLAGLVTRCALAREESRGVHYRVDFPLKHESTPAQHSYISRDSTVSFAF